jgi:hypothetical protein
MSAVDTSSRMLHVARLLGAAQRVRQEHQEVRPTLFEDEYDTTVAGVRKALIRNGNQRSLAGNPRSLICCSQVHEVHDGDGVSPGRTVPADAARLSLSKIRSALKTAGRQRNLDAQALETQTALRTEQLPAPAAITAAFGATTRAVVGIIAELNHQIADLEAELATHLAKTTPEHHP